MGSYCAFFFTLAFRNYGSYIPHTSGETKLGNAVWKLCLGTMTTTRKPVLDFCLWSKCPNCWKLFIKVIFKKWSSKWTELHVNHLIRYQKNLPRSYWPGKFKFQFKNQIKTKWTWKWKDGKQDAVDPFKKKIKLKIHGLSMWMFQIVIAMDATFSLIFIYEKEQYSETLYFQKTINKISQRCL